MATEANIVEDIVVKLKAANVFGAVFEGPVWETPIPQDVVSAAWVEWADSTDEQRTETSVVVTATFKLWVTTKSIERVTARRRIVRLVSALKNALNGQRLASLTIPQFTRTTRTRNLYAMDGPIMTVEIDLTTRFVVSGDSAHDASDTT